MEQSKSFASGDNDVESWFQGNSAGWYQWAREFAHKDPSRLAAVPDEGWNELTEFVVLRDGKLAEGLVADPKMPCLLLQGMLANFICKHAFSTPWWMFDALSHLGVSLEEDERLINNCVRNEERVKQILRFNGGQLPTSRNMDNLFEILADRKQLSYLIWCAYAKLLLQFKRIRATRLEYRWSDASPQMGWKPEQQEMLAAKTRLSLMHEFVTPRT